MPADKTLTKQAKHLKANDKSRPIALANGNNTIHHIPAVREPVHDFTSSSQSHVNVVLAGRAEWGIVSPCTKHLQVKDYLCFPIILRFRLQYTQFFIYTAYTRCVMRKSLIGVWPWCPIHTLSWSCSLKFPLGCSQKAGKQIQMFPTFYLMVV